MPSLLSCIACKISTYTLYYVDLMLGLHYVAATTVTNSIITIFQMYYLGYWISLLHAIIIATNYMQISKL